MKQVLTGPAGGVEHPDVARGCNGDGLRDVSSGPGSSGDDPTPEAPLGPGSLTWRHLGDSRGVLLALRAGVLQAMHPASSAALIGHSDVFENPLWRLVRSAGPILSVIYRDDPEDTATWVRDRHARISGRDHAGRRYHALEPEAFYWAHATFFEAQVATQALFGTPLRPREKEQLYAESITWYARYRLSMRPVPRDYTAFELYWRSTLENVLEATPAALAAVGPGFDLGTPWPRAAGPPLGAASRPLTRVAASLTRSTLPRPALEILGIAPSRGDELLLAGIRAATRTGWPLVPGRMRRLVHAVG